MVLPIIRQSCCASWASDGFTGRSGAAWAARCARACATRRARGTTSSYGWTPTASTTSTTSSVCWLRCSRDGGRRARVPFRRLQSQPSSRSNSAVAWSAVLSMITKRTVTDPTSGFWALGPRAVALLAEHHPAGYPGARAAPVSEPQRHACSGGRGAVSGPAARPQFPDPGAPAGRGRPYRPCLIIVPFRASAGSSDD